MITRTENEKVPHFRLYGGRGIKMCEEWRRDFTKFYEWAKTHGWEKGLQIDRINCDGNYNEKNCRITTPTINCCNRSRSVKGGDIGVHKASRNGKWVAQLVVNGAKIWLGYHDDYEHAVSTRDAYIRKNNLPNSINRN